MKYNVARLQGNINDLMPIPLYVERHCIAGKENCSRYLCKTYMIYNILMMNSSLSNCVSLKALP